MDTMSSLTVFLPLVCHHCKGENFTKVFALSSRAGSGTVEIPKGYWCMGCKVVVDLAQMQAAAHVKLLRDEMAQKQQELDALSGRIEGGRDGALVGS